MQVNFYLFIQLIFENGTQTVFEINQHKNDLNKFNLYSLTTTKTTTLLNMSKHFFRYFVVALNLRVSYF